MANLVFDVPKNSRGVKGGPRPASEDSMKQIAPLFEVKCLVTVSMPMGFGRLVLFVHLRVFSHLSLELQ